MVYEVYDISYKLSNLCLPLPAGSWFIESLCAVLQNLDRLDRDDIHSLLTEVNNRIRAKFASRPELPIDIPQTETSLVKELYLSPWGIRRE